MNVVRVGACVMILRDGKVLLGKRHEDPEKASSELHGEGTWTMPGGKVDFHEDLEEAALREVLEETGIQARGLELISVTNDKIPDNHFVTLGFICRDFDGEAEAREPDEISEWGWFGLEELPSPLFPPTEKMIKNYLDKALYKH